MKYSVRLTGSGGQGIILASIILAEAAGIYDGKNVVQSQVYGAAARGEISKADVIISDEESISGSKDARCFAYTYSRILQ